MQQLLRFLLWDTVDGNEETWSVSVYIMWKSGSIYQASKLLCANVGYLCRPWTSEVTMCCRDET